MKTIGLELRLEQSYGQRMKKIVGIVVILLLSGCAFWDKADIGLSACPGVGLVQGGASVPVLVEGKSEYISENIMIYGFMNNFKYGCSFKETGGVDFVFNIDFTGQKRSTAEIKKKEFPYFIAVLAPDETVLQRQRFSVTLEFDAEGGAALTEEHNIHIPLADQDTVYQYKIAAGFELTDEQLKFNKDTYAN